MRTLTACLLLASPVVAQITISSKPATEGTRVEIVSPDAPNPKPAGEAESPTGRNPKFIWTKRWQFNYQKARAENHPWWQRIKSAADTPEYGDFGQWDALVYQITGDKAYAKKALTKLIPTVKPSDANQVREYYVEYVILYDWLLPAMTAEQKAAYEAGLVKLAEYSMGINQPAYKGGWRLGDSDQTVGQYFGVALTDLALGSDYLSQSEGKLPVGGLDAMATDWNTVRNTIKHYIEMSQGGQWIESTEYNLGTTKLLWLGTEAVKTATGKDHFPEATAFLADLKKSLVAELTPDLQDSFQWGDTEKPHGLDEFHRLAVNNLVGLKGVLPDKIGWQRLTSRAFYAADPFAPAATLPDKLDLRADGAAILLSRDKPGAKLFASHMANRLGVDHTVPYLSHFALWANGEWVIDAPRGYATVNNFNGMKLAGLLSMYDRKLVKSHVAADHAYQIGWTGGPYFDAGFYNPPPAFCRAWIRTVVYLPQFPAVVVYDSIDMDDPKKLPSLDRYAARTPWDLEMIKSARRSKQWVLHTPVEPTIEGNRATWPTEGGQKVTLTSFVDAAYTTAIVDERVDPDYSRYSPSERKFNLTLKSDAAKTFHNVISLGAAVSQIPGGVQVGAETNHIRGGRYAEHQQLMADVGHKTTASITAASMRRDFRPLIGYTIPTCQHWTAYHKSIGGGWQETTVDTAIARAAARQFACLASAACERCWPKSCVRHLIRVEGPYWSR